MKILDAGHCYRLECVGHPTHSVELQFVKREGDNFPFNAGTAMGTNCQEVLRALIDRSEYLNNQKQCAETEAAIGCLRAALLLFELRAARRHNRHLDLKSTQELVNGVTCLKCSHVGCNGSCH